MSKNTLPPLALIGANANEFIKSGFESNGFHVISLPADKRLAPQVESHADMLISVIDDTVFCNGEYYKNNIKIFDLLTEYRYQINASDFLVSNIYPGDVALNQAIVGKRIIGRADSCAESILKYADSHKYEYHSIKQGYAKCSALILGEKAIISADTGIISIAERLGIDTLKIENSASDVTLDGYDYGFIGGASAVYEDKVIFFGDITRHSQGKEIVDFCNKHGFLTTSLGDKRLCDIGGAIILPCLNGN